MIQHSKQNHLPTTNTVSLVQDHDVTLFITPDVSTVCEANLPKLCKEINPNTCQSLWVLNNRTFRFKRFSYTMPDVKTLAITKLAEIQFEIKGSTHKELLCPQHPQERGHKYEILGL